MKDWFTRFLHTLIASAVGLILNWICNFELSKGEFLITTLIIYFYITSETNRIKNEQSNNN